MNTLSKLPQLGAKKKLLVYGLNCVSVDPARSHPNNYWKKDGAKFSHLLKVATEANAKLVLVNYSDKSKNIKRIYVKNIDPVRGIVDSKEDVINRTQYNKWVSYIKKDYKII